MSTAFIPVAELQIQRQLALAFPSSSVSRPIAITPQIGAMLASGCVVAIGVSGGKDSQACAIRTARYLDEIGHTGPRVLVHADLGAVEWRDSQPACERLASFLGLELIVVRRAAGDMLARWRRRWNNNILRYRELSCVRLILPWSTPSMRFCTSELKLAPIASALRKRFPAHAIINVSGIRRQESTKRSRMPVAAIEPRLQRADYAGANWNPIIEWDKDEVLLEVREARQSLHEAYTLYGSSRVSCAFCIMSTARDLRAATTCADNHEVYRAMVALEAESTFAFQGARWLADTAPELLSPELRSQVEDAKRMAQQRQGIESEIPKHLLYAKGWPTVMPTIREAQLVADVRTRLSDLLQLDSRYLTGDAVLDRYARLLETKRAKEATARMKRRRR